MLINYIYIPYFNHPQFNGHFIVSKRISMFNICQIFHQCLTWIASSEWHPCSVSVASTRTSSFPHSWFQGGSYCITLPFLSADHSVSLRFIPTGTLINKYSSQADAVPSQQNESSISNVPTAGIKAHGGIAHSEAGRQLIFPLWLAKLCCSYTNGNGMCMSVPLSLPSLSLSLPSVKTIDFNL